jgi:hypothetical protein
MSRDFQWRAGETADGHETLDREGDGYELDEQEGGFLEEGSYETPDRSYGAAEYEDGSLQEQDAESVFGETDEMGLAAEMLSVTGEGELDEVLGRIIRSAGRAVGGSIDREMGSALGSALKGAARHVFPLVGGAGGGEAGEAFGIETEGLSGEDEDFEIMRRFVRFAGSAAGRAARARRGIPFRNVVRSALSAAARRWAPGFLRGSRFWNRRFRRHDRGPRRYYPSGYGPQVPAPYPPQPSPYPGAPAMQRAVSPGQPGGFDPNASPAGFGGPGDPQGSGTSQGMPEDAGQDSGGGAGALPQSGRWTRQDGKVVIQF